jgi:putative transport protein
MLVWMEQFLVRYPELALFLVLAAGYWIGSFKIGAVSLGPVAGALFAGLLVGQFAHVPVSGMTKSFLFLLFLFGIGYSVGPQFVLALKRDGLKPVLLAVVVCITGLAASILVAKVLLVGSGVCRWADVGCPHPKRAMGTATDAVNGLALPEADRALFAAHIAVADAVCYIFGYAGVIIFCTVIVPRLLKIDLKTEALKLEQALGMNRAKPGLASAWRNSAIRPADRPHTRSGSMSQMGQTEKNLVRAYVFRVTPESGHGPVRLAPRKGAICGDRPTLLDHLVGAAE